MKLGNLEISKIYLGDTEVEKAYLGDTLVHGSDAPVFDGWVYKDGVWLNDCTVLTKKGFNANTLINQGADYLYSTTAAELFIDTPVIIKSGKTYTVTAKVTYCSNANTNHYSALMAYDADEYTSLMAYGANTYRSFNQTISNGITNNGYYLMSTYRSNVNVGIKTSGNEGKRICIYLLNFYGTKYYTEIRIEVT